MKLIELKKIIDELLKENSFQNASDCKVVVQTYDPSIGPSSCSEVTAVGLGFDWERGRVNIYTAEKLIKTK